MLDQHRHQRAETRQQQRIEHAGAQRLLDPHRSPSAAARAQRHLLHRRKRHQRRQRHPQVELIDGLIRRLAVRPSRAAGGGQALADLQQAGRAAEAQHVDVVAGTRPGRPAGTGPACSGAPASRSLSDGISAGGHARRRTRRPARRARPSAGWGTGAAGPRPDGGEHLALAVVTAALSAAVGAAARHVRRSGRGSRSPPALGGGPGLLDHDLVLRGIGPALLALRAAAGRWGRSRR